MRSHVLRSTLSAVLPLGMMLAGPASAASFTLSPDWPNYLLVASIAALALGVTVRALEGRPRHDDPSVTSEGSIDAYRNRALRP